MLDLIGGVVAALSKFIPSMQCPFESHTFSSNPINKSLIFFSLLSSYASPPIYLIHWRYLLCNLSENQGFAYLLLILNSKNN
ncbi:hypothetical protein [Clostridium saccharobutylicum]|uniref:hypothetical protein n=1 Tax=Clostridium saccharobutylicum TaxID=169679 RepID=UPI001F168FDA|nr:hypothetical protein [Clostridium saccharobutylicum]